MHIASPLWTRSSWITQSNPSYYHYQRNWNDQTTRHWGSYPNHQLQCRTIIWCHIDIWWRLGHVQRPCIGSYHYDHADNQCLVIYWPCCVTWYLHRVTNIRHTHQCLCNCIPHRNIERIMTCKCLLNSINMASKLLIKIIIFVFHVMFWGIKKLNIIELHMKQTHCSNQEVSVQISFCAVVKNEWIPIAPEVNSCLKLLTAFGNNLSLWDRLSTLFVSCLISFSKELN